ncbi:hypothetical protein AGABI2DRAFT_70177, partial [Agaricus bisporus var. bisporus H97]|uniref:hypothetical protein n=1 Tax=Agaricus bisporus var. bisporus (strain H97 / ATCC MYA-4626 / FGSC 10389) TaxID=936046 RepID=UPI00029F6096
APVLATEDVLQVSLAHLTTLPALPRVSSPLPPRALFRAAAILSVPWLCLTLLVSPRVIVALLGSVVLTYKAPWVRVLSSVLWRSALFRHLCYRLSAFLTGQAPPEYSVSNNSAALLSSSPQPASSLRFLFTVYENQRWWMGLDWTAALLPGERPSWCSPAFHPVSPPNAFTLPEPTTIYLPSKDGKSRIKRTAIWKWQEPEWTLLVRKEGSSPSRIQRTPPPLPVDEPVPLSPSSSSDAGTRLLKAAASKFKDSLPSDPEADLPEPLTDPDGWVYGDNKWEGQSHRGGLGKFTRYRRWSRIALVTEMVEVIEPGQLGRLT